MHQDKDTQMSDGSSSTTSSLSDPPPTIADVIKRTRTSPSELTGELAEGFQYDFRAYLNAVSNNVSRRENDATQKLLALLRYTFVAETYAFPRSGQQQYAGDVFRLSTDINLSNYRAADGPTYRDTWAQSRIREQRQASESGLSSATSASRSTGVVAPDLVLWAEYSATPGKRKRAGSPSDNKTACVSLIGEHKLDAASEPEAATRRAYAQYFIQLASCNEAFGTALGYVSVNTSYARIFHVRHGVVLIESVDPSPSVQSAEAYLRGGGLFSSLPHDLADAPPGAHYHGLEPLWTLVLAGLDLLALQPLDDELRRLPDVPLPATSRWKTVKEELDERDRKMTLCDDRDIDAYGASLFPSLTRRHKRGRNVDQDSTSSNGSSSSSDSSEGQTGDEPRRYHARIPEEDRQHTKEERGNDEGKTPKNASPSGEGASEADHKTGGDILGGDGFSTPPYDPTRDDLVPFDVSAADLRDDPDWTSLVAELGFSVHTVTPRVWNEVLDSYIAAARLRSQVQHPASLLRTPTPDLAQDSDEALDSSLEEIRGDSTARSERPEHRKATLRTEDANSATEDFAR